MNDVLDFDAFISLVEDYATSVTKRYGLDRCTPECLLLAISELSPSRFSDLLPATSNLCRAFLALTFTDKVIEECDVRLVRRIFGELVDIDAFWDQVKIYADSADVQLAGPSSKSTAIPIKDEIQVNVPISADAESPLSELFVHWCADQTGISFDTMMKSVARDEEVLAGVLKFRELGSDLATYLASQSGFLAIFETLQEAEAGASRHLVARRLALAYLSYSRQVLKAESVFPDVQDQLTKYVRARLDDRAIQNSEVLDIFNKHFDGLYGLTQVKAELLRHVRALLGQRQREQLGLPTVTMTMHLAFLGSPGTGKTEVARAYGKVLAELGVLENGDFHEVSRSDFVARYAGQTEAKTKKLIEKARGGILFIDEAYALDDGDREDAQKGFGQEAIEVLVADLENLRKELLVIVAGYSKEMSRFFNVNSGLRSRIPTSLTFPDFSLADLRAIGLFMIKSAQYAYSSDFESAFEGAIAERMKAPDFGNARGVRNLIDEIRRQQESRLAGLGEFATLSELSTFEVEDIPPLPEGFLGQAQLKRRIGFIQEG